MSSIENGQGKPEVTSTQYPARSIRLLFLSLAGLLISLLSGFQESIPGAGFLCSNACRDTVQIRFLHMPFWLLGVVFYAAVAVLALFRQQAIAWVAAPAAGVEAVLILIMIQIKAPCVFCISNAVVVILLLAAAFRKELFWQQTTLAFLFFVAFFFWVPFENNLSHAATAGRGGYYSGVAATVGGDVITNQRLDVLLGSRLLETRRNIFRMKMDKLDQLIVEMVLDKEAKKQGKTLEQLIEQVAPPGSVTVTDSEIDKYLQDNQQRLKAYETSIPDLRGRIKTFLQQEKRSQAIRNYAHALEPQYGVRIFLPMPTPPKVKVDIRGAPALGPPNAPVTVVEFSDYECPACRSTHPVVKEVRAAYGNKLRWVYKDFPLKRHPDAFRAAEASHCAEDQGKFWQYQDKLFTSSDLSSAGLINIAVQLGLSRKKFTQCLKESKYKALVEKNIRDDVQAGIDRTPTFMINGTLFVGGPSLATFKRLINAELKKSEHQVHTAQKTP